MNPLVPRRATPTKLMDVMTRNVRVCSIDATLADVVRIMVEHDCGGVPLVDAKEVVVAMITDRDVSVAAYTQGLVLSAVTARSAASRQIYVAHVGDDLEKVGAMMQMYKVRRLPVVDSGGLAIGIVTLGDVAQHAAHSGHPRELGLRARDILQTLAAVSGQASAWFDGAA